MQVNIKLETIFKSLAGAVVPLAIWLINLNSQVTELSNTVKRLESSNSPRIAKLAEEQAKMAVVLERIKEDTDSLKMSYERVSQETRNNSAAIREMRVSLRYIEEGVQVIKTRLLGPASPQ